MEVYRTLFLINETIFLTMNYGNGPVIIVFTGPARLFFFYHPEPVVSTELCKGLLKNEVGIPYSTEVPQKVS